MNEHTIITKQVFVSNYEIKPRVQCYFKMDVYCLLWRNPHFFRSISRKSLPLFLLCVISTFLEKKVRNPRLKLPFLLDKLVTITSPFLPYVACNRLIQYKHHESKAPKVKCFLMNSKNFIKQKSKNLNSQFNF